MAAAEGRNTKPRTIIDTLRLNEVLDVCEAIQVMNEKAVIAEKIAAAKRMLRLNKFSVEEIAEISELTIEEVEALTSKETA